MILISFYPLLNRWINFWSAYFQSIYRNKYNFRLHTPKNVRLIIRSATEIIYIVFFILLVVSIYFEGTTHEYNY